MQDPHGQHFWFDAQCDADIATCRSGDARLLSGWASSRIAYRTAGPPRQDCVQSIFLWNLARFSFGATCGIWQAFPLATNTQVSASSSRWLRDLGVCASASWRFALLLGSMVLPCSFWTIASIALETTMCLTFGMSSTVSIVALMGFASGRTHRHIFTYQDQKLSCCVARGNDVAAEERTQDNAKVCQCRRGPDQDLYSGKKKITAIVEQTF